MKRPTREEFEDACRSSQYREQIAGRFGVSIITVNRWAKLFDVTLPNRAPRDKAPSQVGFYECR